jgi:DNA polymerase-3 subunit alpha
LRRVQSFWQAGQMSLFGWVDSNEGDWTLTQKVAAQVELLGASLDAHPLELVAEKIAGSGAITTLEAVERVGRRVTVAGVRQTSHRSRTAKGESMLFLTLEDLQGTLDAILFPDAYRAAKSLVGTSSPLLVTGVMEMDSERGEPYLRVERVAQL